jgi:AmmeMemoRadiSam system protein B
VTTGPRRIDVHRPRLVALVRRAAAQRNGQQIELRDASGVAPRAVLLSPAGWWVASRFDGRRTCAEIAAEARAEGSDLADEDVSRLARQLAGAGLVEGAEREALRARALAAYRAGGVRAPSFAGGIYPRDPGSLRADLDRQLAAAEGAPRDAPVRLLVAPHIDYVRGGPGYGHAYGALAAADADLFVVFGTAHAAPSRLFTLTRLDYATPLGPVETDRAVVDAIAGALGEDEVLGDELCHREEHSCELQMPWLRHVVQRPFRALPVLCASVSDLPDPAAATRPFLAALAAAVRGRRVCFVAGADLAHLGPAYGDARSPTQGELAASAARDRNTMARVAAGDPEGFRRDAADGDVPRRICGVAPIYAAMRASGIGAALLHYQQWTDGTDSVSFAAAAG